VYILNNISKGQSRFTRTLHNEKKQGAYYTDDYHCKLIRNLFHFPDEPFCALDPSIGDGNALAVVTGKNEGTKAINYGVEINRERYLDCKKNEQIDHIICGDFNSEVKITNEVFSFCFANPPYMTSICGDRMEKIFLRRIDTYICKGGILCMIVPIQLFDVDPAFISIFVNRYDILSILRFQEPEYSKYKQIIFIGRKKNKIQIDLDFEQKIKAYVSDPDKIIIIPDSSSEKIAVPVSNPDNISTFLSTKLNVDELKLAQGFVSLPSKFLNISIKNGFSELGNPPIMPGADHQYLLAVCGFGSGKVGDEGQQHLQRGCVLDDVKVIYKHDDTEDSLGVYIERKSKKTVFTVIESDGTITELK